MKVLLKSSIKYITVITFLIGLTNMSFGQSQRGDASQRLIDAEQELYELIQIDKKSLSKSEVKVWKKQKRHLERIINEEKGRDDFYTYNRYRNRYGSSYYSPYGGYGYYSNRYYRYPRRVIVVRRR